ncbi:hypothetical protein [Microbacterium sp. KR10-403]|uniref:hypothetical protein n=1 Tax=Microbacterium sp. KR10-403 TaxID=3158581 RepID=UPI0032E44CC9
MTRVYATAAQVAALVGITPGDAALRRASRQVDRILHGAEYATSDDGMPTSAGVAQLLTEMTAEQIAWFGELGDETGAAGLGGGRIGTVTLPHMTATPADVLLSPVAVELAEAAGLIRRRVRT